MLTYVKPLHCVVFGQLKKAVRGEGGRVCACVWGGGGIIWLFVTAHPAKVAVLKGLSGWTQLPPNTRTHRTRPAHMQQCQGCILPHRGPPHGAHSHATVPGLYTVTPEPMPAVLVVNSHDLNWTLAPCRGEGVVCVICTC